MKTYVKRCNQCGVDKAIERFHKHSGMADGHYNQCKVCQYQDQAAKRRADQRSKDNPNPISVLLQNRGWM